MCTIFQILFYLTQSVKHLDVFVANGAQLLPHIFSFKFVKLSELVIPHLLEELHITPHNMHCCPVGV